MAEVTKQPPPEPVVQPSVQQTAATLAPIAAQGAAAESSWFDDAGKTALAVGGFVGDRMKAGLEAGMDESRVLRLVGGLLGAESPSMRRAGLQEDILNQNLELGKLRLAEAKAESIRNANTDKWNEEVRNRQREEWKLRDKENARKEAVNATATSKALYSAYEGEAAKQVEAEARDEYFALANRAADTVLRTTDQFTPDAQVFEAMKGSRVVQEATTTRAALAMLDSKNPLVQQAAVSTAQQYGIELAQREGKWFMQLPNGDGEFELNERNRKWITAQLVGEIATEAQAKTRLKQWEQHAVSNGFLVAANRLRNEVGIGDAAKQEEKIAAIARAIPQKDLELYGALNTLKQLYDGGLKKEEIPVMEAQLEKLAAKFGIEHNGGDGGVFLIEGKNPVKYAEERLAQNPFTLALNREIQTRKAEGVRRLAQLAAEAAAKKGAGMGGEEPTGTEREVASVSQSGRKLAQSRGNENWGEKEAWRFNRNKAEDKQVTPDMMYAVLSDAKESFTNAIANGKKAETAYDEVVDVFKKHDLDESYIPDFFREARDEGKYRDFEREYAATQREYVEAKKAYEEAKPRIAREQRGRHYIKFSPEEKRLQEAEAKWKELNDRKLEADHALGLSRQRRREAKEQAQAAEAKRREAGKLLTGDRGEKPKQKPKGKQR